MASSSFPLALSMWFYCLEQLCCSENCLIPEHKQAAFPTSKQCPWSPWDYSCIANISLGAGNDGYRHFSALDAPPKSYLVNKSSHPGTQTATLPPFTICVICSRVWIEARVPVCNSAFQPALSPWITASDSFLTISERTLYELEAAEPVEQPHPSSSSPVFCSLLSFLTGNLVHFF